jgi:hypothetical protein
MKNWSIISKKQLLVTTLGILLIGSIFIYTNIHTKTSLSTNTNIDSSLCIDMTEIQSDSKGNANSKSLQFHPIKIVVEPWRGEHNVYAIFAVPLQYQDIYFRSHMLVKGTKTPWDVTIANEQMFRVKAPKDHFLLVGFFRTRLTLLYLITGKFSDLHKPCNWTLYIFPTLFPVSN